MKDSTKQFLNSIKEKIDKYAIETTVKEAAKHINKHFITTKYNNGVTEIIDSGVEYFLCATSPIYFLKRYAWIDFPGVGVIPFNLYHFQEEGLKLILKKQNQLM